MALLSLVIARLDRAIQYSRDASVSAEKPRRTGSPACAGDDSEYVALALPFPNIASHSRGPMRPRFETVSPSTVEGAGNAGCALHPRSRVQDAQGNAHTSIQVQRRQSGIPCAMALRLMPCSCVRKICQNVRTGGSDQPPVAGSEPDRAQRPRACRGARDRSGVFLNPNSCMGFEPEPSKEGSG